MNRKTEDDELDKLLDDELIWEAEMIEKGLLSDDGAGEEPMSRAELDASFDRLVERLKAEGVYREDEDEDESAASEEENASDRLEAAEEPLFAGKNAAKVISMSQANASKAKRMERRHKIIKAAGIVVVCFLGVLGASLTSEANRKYFVKKIDYLTGNDTRIDVDTIEGKNVDGQGGLEEQDAIDAIGNILGIKMPQFIYRPDTFEFSEYKVSPKYEYAFIQYQYKNNEIILYVGNKSGFNKRNNYSVDGKKVNTVYSDKGDIEVEIIETRDKNDKSASYMAQWEYDSVFYLISGRMEPEEFEKLIEKMVF